MADPWQYWYHCTVHTYGTWLPGDPRGWRSEHGRYHVDGDYKNPPPAGKYEALHTQSRNRMKRDPIMLVRAGQQIVLDAVLEKLTEKNVPVAAAALDDHHLHVVVQCTDCRPRHWIGLAKRSSAVALKNAGFVEAGGIWSKRGLCKPIGDETHFHRAVAYVLKHSERGSIVWAIEKAYDRTPLRCGKDSHGFKFENKRL